MLLSQHCCTTAPRPDNSPRAWQLGIELLCVTYVSRNLRQYDAAHDPAQLKDMENGGKFRDVEEDAFQKKVDGMLQAQEVDPNDKSLGAYMTRFRCGALVAQLVQAVIVLCQP